MDPLFHDSFDWWILGALFWRRCKWVKLCCNPQVGIFDPKMLEKMVVEWWSPRSLEKKWSNLTGAYFANGLVKPPSWGVFSNISRVATVKNGDCFLLRPTNFRSKLRSMVILDKLGDASPPLNNLGNTAVSPQRSHPPPIGGSPGFLASGLWHWWIPMFCLSEILRCHSRRWRRCGRPPERDMIVNPFEVIRKISIRIMNLNLASLKKLHQNQPEFLKE